MELNFLERHEDVFISCLPKPLVDNAKFSKTVLIADFQYIPSPYSAFMFKKK